MSSCYWKHVHISVRYLLLQSFFCQSSVMMNWIQFKMKSSLSAFSIDLSPFRFWATKDVILEACTLSMDSDSVIECHRASSGVSPAPLHVTFTQTTKRFYVSTPVIHPSSSSISLRLQFESYLSTVTSIMRSSLMISLTNRHFAMRYDQ